MAAKARSQFHRAFLRRGSGSRGRALGPDYTHSDAGYVTRVAHGCGTHPDLRCVSMQRGTIAGLVALIGLLAGLFVSLVPASPNFSDFKGSSSPISCPNGSPGIPLVVVLTAWAQPQCPHWLAANDSVDEGGLIAAAGIAAALLLLAGRGQRTKKLVAKISESVGSSKSGRRLGWLVNSGGVAAVVVGMSGLIGILFVVASSA
jgi:hypothetical protein